MAPKMVPSGPKTAQRRLQVAKEPPKEAPMRPKSYQNLRKINVDCFLPVSLPMAIKGLKMAPRWPKRAPLRGPREPQNGPKSAQERSKSAPRSDVWSS
eukprot:1789386-Pyramimonas_sp.AAC.1